MTKFDWKGTSVTGDLFNGPPHSDAFCTKGNVPNYDVNFCGKHEWTDNNNIIPITYKGLPGRRYGYMGKPPKELMNFSNIPRPVFSVNTLPLKCIYEDRAHFIVVYNEEANIKFYGAHDDDPGNSPLNISGKYNDFQTYAEEHNPWAKCTPKHILNFVKSLSKADETSDYDGAAIFDWQPINVEGTTRTSMIQKVVDEVNILGVTIFTPLFSTTTPDKCECFCTGLFFYFCSLNYHQSP